MDATFFRTLRGNDRSLYSFFDEVQNVEGWQKWNHKKVERPALDHFFVTGSNARLLSRELGSTLTGRQRIITLFPFSYEELRGQMPGFTVEDYIRIGGFPGVVGKPDGDALLRQYFNDIVEKDIVTRLGIGNSRALKQIVKMLFESGGSECSFRKLAGSAGLSADTVATAKMHISSIPALILVIQRSSVCDAIVNTIQSTQLFGARLFHKLAETREKILRT